VLDYADSATSAELVPRASADSAVRVSSPTPMMAECDDRDLMRHAQEGNERAFASLVRRHQQRLFRVALHMLRDTGEAEDVTQDTFVRAYRALSRFDGRSQPYTWFYRIAVNLALNRIRSRKRSQSNATLEDPRLECVLVDSRPQNSPAQHASGRQLALSLCQAIDSLSETLRTTLILVVIDGVPHQEAAVILGCPEGTVAWRVHEARRKIKAFLIEAGHHPEDD
jgi:RNA polymerase sigma-70 factor, ECF subfamily